MKKLWLVGATILTSTAVIAQTSVNTGKKPVAPAKSTLAPVNKGNVVIRPGAKSDSIYDHNKGVASVKGGVTVTQIDENFILEADNLTYDDKANQAQASGNLRIQTADSTITGLSLIADFNAKRFIINGKVVMSSRGPNDGIHGSATNKDVRGKVRSEVFGKPSRMTCDHIDYNYENRDAIIEGNIRLTQDDKKGTCEQILFDEAQNIVQLRRNGVYTDGKKQRIKAPLITVWLDSDIIKVDGGVLNFPRNDNNKPTPAQPKTNLGNVPQLPNDVLTQFGRPLPPASAPAPIDDDATAQPGEAPKTGAAADQPDEKAAAPTPTPPAEGEISDERKGDDAPDQPGQTETN